MKKVILMIIPALFCGVVLTNCNSNLELEDNGVNGVYSTDNEHIKSVSSNGTIVHKYLYDLSGKIVEENSKYYFKRYLYSETDRLIKVESAFDRSGLSSSAMPVERTEFMTSQNSTVDSYSLYEYDKERKLSKIEHYFNETGNGFEYRSMQTFEYEGSYIKKVNLHEPKGQITSYRVYTYDKHGNVTNEKYFSCNFSSDYKLISETSFLYDNYKNPYRIFNILGSPGLFANVNNIIETNTIRHEDVAGFDKYSSSKTTYQYNKDGYPIKEITENSEFEYKY
jgi:hypothetical protein